MLLLLLLHLCVMHYAGPFILFLREFRLDFLGDRSAGRAGLCESITMAAYTFLRYPRPASQLGLPMALFFTGLLHSWIERYKVTTAWPLYTWSTLAFDLPL